MNRTKTTFGAVEVRGKYYMTRTSKEEYTKYKPWYGATSLTSPISPMYDRAVVWVEKAEPVEAHNRLPTTEEVQQCPPIVQFWFVYLCNKVAELQQENINLLKDKVDLLTRLMKE